jgi:hypothetical protein
VIYVTKKKLYMEAITLGGFVRYLKEIGSDTNQDDLLV